LGDLDAFSEQLARALEGRDFDALRSIMRERFSIPTWNSQQLEFTSKDALQRLRQDALAAGVSPAVVFGADVPTLLEGADPLASRGPVANTVRALYVTGLGMRAIQEAITCSTSRIHILHCFDRQRQPSFIIYWIYDEPFPHQPALIGIKRFPNPAGHQLLHALPRQFDGESLF
jgi:hypothetical protein